MKTYLFSSKLRYSAAFILLIVSNCVITDTGMAFQPHSEAYPAGQNFDHVINGRGESRISLFTGLPVVGSVEYAYGITDRLTVGILGGFTPFEEAIGIRIRTILYQRRDSYRVYFCTPIVLYPQLRRVRSEPWLLTRPNLNFEWLRKSNVRYKIGGSVIASAASQELFGGSADSKHQTSYWTAVHGGISLPVSRKMTFQTELSYVMKGIQTVRRFYGGPPIILIAGISHTF